MGNNLGMTNFPSSHSDLLDAQIGTLATIGANGIPQQTAVWSLHEDGHRRSR